MASLPATLSPPASPPAPGDPRVKSARFYWLPGLPNHDFAGRIRSVDSVVSCTSGFFSNLDLNSIPPQRNTNFFLPSLNSRCDTSHTQPQCLVNDPPAAPLRAPLSLRAPLRRRLPSSRPGLRLHTPRLPRLPTSLLLRPLPPRARGCSARWLPQLRTSDL